MAYAKVQSKHVQGTGSTYNGSFTTLPTVGNLVILAISSSFAAGSGPATTPTDNQSSNTYTQVGTATQASTGDNIQIFYTVVTTSSGTFTVSTHFPGTQEGSTMAMFEYSGNNSVPFDKQATNTGSSSTPALASSITPTNANSLAFSAIVDANVDGVTISAGTNYTIQETQLTSSTLERIGTEHWIQTTATATTGAFTLGSSAAWALKTAIFLPAASGDTISVTDSSAGTESITMSKVDMLSTPSDTTTVSEVITPRITDMLSTVVDTSAVSEVITPLLVNTLSTLSDTSTVTESIIPLLTDFLSVSDTSTVSESIGISYINYLSVSDSSTVTDTLSLLIPVLLPDILLDASTVSENISTSLTNVLSLADSSTVSEVITAEAPLAGVIVEDDTTVSENILLGIGQTLVLSDSSTVSESISTALVISVALLDHSTVTEDIGTSSIAYTTLLDSSTVSEAVSASLVNSLSVSDSSTVSDSLGLFVPINISLSDSSVLDDVVSHVYENPIDLVFADYVGRIPLVLIEGRPAYQILQGVIPQYIFV